MSFAWQNSTNSSNRIGQDDSSASQPANSGGSPTAKLKSRKEHHWSRLSLKSSGFVPRNSRKSCVCRDRSSTHKGSKANAVSRSRKRFVPSLLNSKQKRKKGLNSPLSRKFGSNVPAGLEHADCLGLAVGREVAVLREPGPLLLGQTPRLLGAEAPAHGEEFRVRRGVDPQVVGELREALEGHDALVGVGVDVEVQGAALLLLGAAFFGCFGEAAFFFVAVLVLAADLRFLGAMAAC